MTLNLTLVVQILHFLIAAYCLRRWLFTPLFAHIVAEEQQQAEQDALLATHQARATAAQQEKEAELQACVQYFSSNKPTIEEQAPAVVPVPDTPVVELTPAQQSKLKQELVTALTERAQK